MRSRWFHIPTLHVPHEGVEKRVGWLELFYDLIFVASFIQLGNGLSHHVSLSGFFSFVAIFIPLWTAWTGFTYYANRFNVDDILHRVFVLIQMFAVGAMAITAPKVLEGNPTPFAIAYGFAQLMIALLYFRSWKQEPHGKQYSKYWGSVFGIGAGIWFLSCFVPPPWCYGMWALGIIAVLSSPFSAQSRALVERYPIDQEHLSERYGLLTLIVLGESFVKVLSSLSLQEINSSLLLQASFTLSITVCIWWIYFDDVAGSKIKKEKLNPIVWLYSHLPLQIGITAVGVAIKKAVFFDLSSPAPLKYRWFLCGTLALTFISVAIIDSVTERRHAELSDRARVNMRSFSAMLILLLAPASSTLSALWFLGLVTLLCVAQVIFDMMMAPLEEVEHQDAPVRTIHEITQDNLANHSTGRPPRRDINDSIQKGTPNELRNDLYFYFMEGSWVRFLVALVFIYAVVNVFFAALYSLQPDSIATGRPANFADAFFFSVQTMSTIGYGAMSPATLYGDIIVTIEAAVAILGVALVTGLMFAKVSRPRSSILFSKPLVITRRHGKKILQLRVGNARGNDVVDASLTLSALIDDISPEGEHLRRVHDLKLSRNRQPFFKLSWTIFHEINEESPLYNIDFSHNETPLISILSTLTGHDGTYGQTIYSRMTYYPEDIRSGHHFIDVIHQLPDGRMMVDYHKFHDTKPDGLSEDS